MPKALGDIIQGTLGGVNAHQAQKGANQSGDSMKSMLKQGYKVAGLDPKVQQQILDRYRNMVRGAQADRGIYSSGPGLQQESEIMPGIEQNLKNMYFQQLMELAGGYGQHAGVVGNNAALGQASAKGWGMMGEGAGNIGLSSLEMMFGGAPTGSSHGYGMPSSMANTGKFGLG